MTMHERIKAAGLETYALDDPERPTNASLLEAAAKNRSFAAYERERGDVSLAEIFEGNADYAERLVREGRPDSTAPAGDPER